MRHKYVIALAVILFSVLNDSNGLFSEEDLLANKCPHSVFVPTHGSTRTVTWTPPYAQNRPSILKHIRVHPKKAKPPFEAPVGDTHIKYTLALENGEETSCSFKITVFRGITIIRRPRSRKYALNENGSFRLSCMANSPDNDDISYKWLFNDSPLKYDRHRVWDATYYSLSLKHLKPKHSGKYTCVAYTTGKRKSEALVSTNVNVHEKLKIVNRPEKKYISIIEGDSLRLPCKANYPDNLVSYKLYLNGSDLKYDKHIQWRASQHKLFLKSVQVKHSGIYTCEVRNPWATTSMDIHITIHAERYSFTAWGGWSECLSDSGSSIGHRSRFRTCVTSSEKEAPGKCSGKTKQVENCDIEVSTPSHPPRTPTPTDVELTSSVIPVKRPSEEKEKIPVTRASESKEEAIIGATKVVAPSKPKEGIAIIRRPKSSTYVVNENGSFRLSCMATSPDNDDISYKWLFNDSPLKYDRHRVWDANYYSLSLKHLKPKHSGKYTCVAYTTGKRKSEASVNAKVHVKGKLKIVNRPEKNYISIIKGDSLRLPCKANYPDNLVSYKLYLNGSVLKYDKHIEWRASQHELFLKSVQVKHSGIYKCEVRNPWATTSMDVHITIHAERYSFTAWGGWSECLSDSGSSIGHRSRFRTCMTSSEKEAPGKCSGKKKQVENCDIEVSTPSHPPRTPTPTDVELTSSVIPVTRPSESKEEAIIGVKKVVAPSKPKDKSKFLDTFYGKLALGSSLAILVVILGCAVFILIGRRIEKKGKKKRRGYKPIKDLEDVPPSKDEYSDDYEDELDRKAFEKRRVIKELTPKERKRSELDDDLIVARSIILEEGINKDHEREVAEKRKQVVRTTSSAGCKKSLLESINSSRAIILDKDTTTVDNAEKPSVSFSPRGHKTRISSAGSSRGSSYHSLEGIKSPQNENNEDSFSMMMVQPVQPVRFEARQATIKHTQHFDVKP